MAKADKEPEEEAGEGGEEAAPKRKLPLKLMIMIAGGVVLLGVVGVGAYMMLGHGHQVEAAASPPKPAIFVDMPEVLVNLSSTGNGRAHYLKAKIVLEVTDQKIAEEIKPVLPRVLDSFQTYLREMRSSDLEGSAGLYRVRDELTRRVNLAVAPSRINAVLFKEIVVQ
jgi:flagellar FliL protein